MASIMTIRDKEGNIIDIPVIQGPPGREGPIGKNGIYVGSGDMPDGYNIQIDPNGDLLKVANVPVPTIEDTGKALVVNDEGNYILEEAGAKDAILYTPQTLTEEQKAQARENIGAGDTEITADKISGGTFSGAVVANEEAQADMTTPMLRNSVIVTTDPGDGAAVDYPIGTEINVV